MAASGYPAQWEADVVLADGGTAHVRPIVPEDADRWSRFVSRLSPRTIYYRFFTEHPRLGPAEPGALHQRRLRRPGGVRRPSRRRDRWRGALRPDNGHAWSPRSPSSSKTRTSSRGLGSILLEHLAAAARERGLQRFEAEVLTENIKMIRVFRDAGYRVEREIEG